jgi:hypothetical protein
MMNNRELQRHYRTQAILSIRNWIALTLIAIIGIALTLFSPRADPLDASAVKNTGIVRQIHVVDSANNGFRVVYATKEKVTADRLYEIQTRPAVRDSLERLKRAAPKHFGNMLYTDIYDFADFATPFDPADVRIHNIFVFGPDKQRLYIGDNPRLENEAKWINSATGQGLLYLKAEDIYFHQRRRRRVYRFFRCRGVEEASDIDEHFSHFREDDRIY